MKAEKVTGWHIFEHMYKVLLIKSTRLSMKNSDQCICLGVFLYWNAFNSSKPNVCNVILQISERVTACPLC